MAPEEPSSHSCQAVVLHCIDFRFKKELDTYLNQRFPKGYDLISLAGSCKGLLSDEDHRKLLLEQFQISSRLHHPKTIALVQHEDCGAYGGSGAFRTPEEELEHQGQELQKASVLLKEHFSQHQIETYFIGLSGELVSM